MDTHFKFPIAPEDAQVGDMIHGDIHGKHWCESIVDVTEGYLHTMRHMLYFDAFRTLNGPVIYRIVSDTPKTTLIEPEEVSLADARPGMWSEFDVPKGYWPSRAHHSGELFEDKYHILGVDINGMGYSIIAPHQNICDGVENLHIYRTKPVVTPQNDLSHAADVAFEKWFNREDAAHDLKLLRNRMFREGWLAGHRKALEPLSAEEEDLADNISGAQAALQSIAKLRGERCE